MATDSQVSSSEADPLRDVLVSDLEHWEDGPPNELFREMRAKCPVHWSEEITEYPEEDGFWSVTTADDVHTVSRDWRTYSSAHGITALTHAILPLVPRFSIWCGTTRTEDWHTRFRARAVVFGHLHIPRTFYEDGVAFEEVSLGYPRQWANRRRDPIRQIWPRP